MQHSSFQANGESMTSRKFQAFLLAIVTQIFCLVQVGTAQVMTEITVYNHLSMPFTNNNSVQVLLTDYSDPLFPVDYTYTADSSGVVTIPNLVLDKFYEVSVSPVASPTAPGNPVIIHYKEPELIYFDSAQVVSSTLSMSVQTDQSTDHYLAFGVREGVMNFSNMPIQEAEDDELPGVLVSYFSDSETLNPNFLRIVANSNGRGFIPFPDSSSQSGTLPVGSEIIIEFASANHAGTNLVFKTTKSVGPEPLVAKMPPLLVSTVISFEDLNGNPFTIPNGEAGEVTCNFRGGPHFVDTQAEEGVSEVSLLLPLGKNSCRFQNENGTLTSSVVEIDAMGASVTADPIVFFEKDAPVTINVGIDDGNGNLVPLSSELVCLDVSLPFIPGAASNTSDFNSECDTDGLGYINMNLLPNTEYEIFVDVFNETDPNSYSQYSASSTLIRFTTLDSSQPAVEVDIALTALDATIFVNDSTRPQGNYHIDIFHEGSSVASTRVNARVSSNQYRMGAPGADPGDSLFFGGPALLGPIPVLSGIEYEVRVLPLDDPGNFNPNDPKSFLDSAPVLVTPSANQNVVLDISVPTPDYNLTVNATFKDIDGNNIDAATVDFFNCHAENESGQSAGAFSPGANSSLVIPLQTAGQKLNYEINCFGPATTAAGERLFHGKVSYVSKTKNTSDAVGIDIVEFGTFYEPTEETFSLSSSYEIELPDGSILSIPENAFGTTGGDATIYIQSPQEYSISDEEFPLFAWDFSLEVNGEEFSGDFTEPLILSKVITKEDFVAQYGVQPEEFNAAVWNESSYNWNTGEGALSVDDNGDGTLTISLTIEHFSIWSTLINISFSLKSLAVSGLSKKILNKKSSAKKKKVKLCWSEVEGGDSETYTLQYYNKKSKKVKKAKKNGEDPWELAKSKTVSGTVDGEICQTVKLKAGKYAWRVQILDGDIWSDEKSIKVKK